MSNDNRRETLTVLRSALRGEAHVLERCLSDAEVLVPAARLCGVFGNYQGSLALLRKALQLDPNHADAKEALAYVERQVTS